MILYDHDLLVNFNDEDPRNLSLFIKEQPQGVTNSPRGFYKFVVDGVSYFLPNYGFIVIFDPLSVSEDPIRLEAPEVSHIAKKDGQQTGGGLANNPLNLEIYGQQPQITKLRYEDPVFINPSPLFPIYNHVQSKHHSDHYKQLIINELSKIPSHEINESESFFVYSKNLYNDKFSNKNEKVEVYNRMIDKFLGFEWMFNRDFSLAGGIRFSEKIKTLCSRLKKDLKIENTLDSSDLPLNKLDESKDPKIAIINNFKNYLHGKIGSVVMNFDRVLKDPPSYNLKDGQIIGYLDDEVNGNTIYKWGIVSKGSYKKFELIDGQISYKSDFKIIKTSDDNSTLIEEEFNQYYCKIPVDEKMCPLYTIRSKEGKESIIDTYEVNNK